MGAKAYRGMERWMGERLLRQMADDSARCEELNTETLVEILKRNKGTEWGTEKGFAEMLASDDPVKAFREAVPVTSYEDFADHVGRIAAGEKNVLCADPVLSLSQSSGTTGRSKLVPVTKASQMKMVMQMATLLPTHADNEVVSMGGEAAPYYARDINLMSMGGDPQMSEGGIRLGSGSADGMIGVLDAGPQHLRHGIG